MSAQAITHNGISESITPNKQPLTALLKAAGDDLRLDILRALKTDSLGVLELCHVLEVKQSGMSHHLKVLAKAGLVITRREGNSIFYRRDNTCLNPHLHDAKTGLFNSLDTLPLEADKQIRLNTIYQQRAHTSQTFFSDNASKFKEQQDLIAAFDVYEKHVMDVLLSSQPVGTEHVVEIGPGEGDLLPFLSAQFKHVHALDNSHNMLSKAQALAHDHNLKNIIFKLGDTTQLNALNLQFDCAVMNMVLHHTPSPHQLFEDISRTLKDGGTLIICDLCEHQQEWAKQACGDIWLGFDPQDLTSWAQDNDLHSNQEIYVALRNGFQIQIRQFTKRLST